MWFTALKHTHTQWHRMTRMTGPDCVVMCNLINTHTHTYINTHTFLLWGRVSQDIADMVLHAKEAGLPTGSGGNSQVGSTL